MRPLQSLFKKNYLIRLAEYFPRSNANKMADMPLKGDDSAKRIDLKKRDTPGRPEKQHPLAADVFCRDGNSPIIEANLQRARRFQFTICRTTPCSLPPRLRVSLL